MRLFVLLSLSFQLFGQEVVTWNPEMGHVYQGGRYLAFAKNRSGTSMVTTFSKVANGWIEATIAISNASDAPVDFFPGDCTMQLASSGRVLSRLDPERLAKWILNKDAASIRMARIAAANLENPIYGGKARAAAAWQNIRVREAAIQQNAQSVMDRAFRTETILPGQNVAGVIYFEQDKACVGGCRVLLRVAVATTTYEFPLYCDR